MCDAEHYTECSSAKLVVGQDVLNSGHINKKLHHYKMAICHLQRSYALSSIVATHRIVFAIVRFVPDRPHNLPKCSMYVQC